MLKILGICSSPRKGATEYSLKQGLEAAETLPEVESDIILLRNKNLPHCIHCDRCIREDSKFCVYHDDYDQEIYEKFYEADGYLIASPVYMMNINAQLTSYFNLLRPTWNEMQKDPAYFWGKAGAAISVGGTRHGGQETTINSTHGFFHTHGIHVIGGAETYNGGTVWSKDNLQAGAKDDEEGMRTVKAIGQRLAIATYQLKYGQEKTQKLLNELELY